MAETQMPATEAHTSDSSLEEHNSYECAFHVLPTVAEGEVATVFGELKDIITKAGGEIFDEESPERIDLAYDIVEHLEGKNRKFSSAYFGWVRFRAEGASIATITHEIDVRTDILRYLVIRLTKVEEMNPFRFHEARKDEKMVTTVDESKVVPDFTSASEEGPVTEAEEDTTSESAEAKEDVDEKALDEALEKKEV